MGGEGAKERRRLKRLGQNGGDTETGAEAETISRKIKRNDARTKPIVTNQLQNKPFGKGPKVVGRSIKNNDKNSYSSKHAGANKNIFQAKSKEKASKKPKHLKRKLEQLGEDNAEEREAVLEKLNEWESAKENFCAKKKNDTSKQETMGASPEERSEETEEIKAFSWGVSSENSVSKKKESSQLDSSEKSSSGIKSTHSKPYIKENKTAHSTDKETRSVPSKEKNDEIEETKAFPKGDSSEESVNEKKEASDPNSSSSKSSSDTKTTPSKPNEDEIDDSDSDDEPGEPRRQRGRRRRGRKDSANLVAEIAPVVEDTKATARPSQSADAGGDEDKGETAATETKKQKVSSRHCTGRKPVTDFAVGECYPGKVVYVKPFGVFIDIGCHSDAFCHVSRLSDDYVESPEAMFKEGDELVPRIVEIDRKQRKITVSLQSEKRIADEHTSMVARKERRVLRKMSSKAKPFTLKNESSRDDCVQKAPASIEKSATRPPRPVAEAAPKPNKSKPILTPYESSITSAELKRARKLARRAGRRGAQINNHPNKNRCD